MNKEEKDLIQCDLILTYIKNKDYSTYYRRKVDDMAIDNDILKNEDSLYITTSKKYNSLQKENKQLKDNWNELKKWLEEKNICFCEEEILNKMQELGKSGINE